MRLSLLLIAASFFATLLAAPTPSPTPTPTPTPNIEPPPGNVPPHLLGDQSTQDPVFTKTRTSIPVATGLRTGPAGTTVTNTALPTPPAAEAIASPWTPDLPLARQPDYTLSRDWDVDAPPTTRHFDWTVTAANQAPDGFGRTVISINGQTPGPLLEANEGDRIIVRVRNGFDQPITIHWHGLDQNGTSYADGVPGFTQCPIQPDDEFVYDFTLAGQFGTFWYHSHDGVQYTDGLSGALIVHSKRDPYRQGRDYDDEIVLFATDWYHSRADLTAIALNTFQGFNGSSVAPPGQSVVVNGYGRWDCSGLPNNPLPAPLFCMTPEWPTLEVGVDKTYRIRLINGGSHAQFRVSIDEHTLSLIGVDMTPIVPRPIDIFPIHNGQRHDFLFSPNRTGSFWMRLEVQTQCFAYIDGKATDRALINVVVGNKASTPSLEPSVFMDPPKSQPFNDTLGAECLDLPDADLRPILPQSVPDVRASAVRTLHTQFGLIYNPTLNASRGIFAVSNVSQTTFPYRPYIRTIRDGARPDPSTISYVEWSDDDWAGDLILQNDNFRGLTHPIHIHSRAFWIVARGNGTLSVDEWERLSPTFNTRDPPLRDTVTLDGQTWAVLRFILDTPGIWALHCHIAWHLSQGFLGATIVRPSGIDESQWPKPNEDLCRRAMALGIPTNATSLP